MTSIQNFGRWLFRHKGKIALIPLIAIAWVPFLFPYSDLRSVVSTTLSRAIGNGTAIDFDHVSLAMGLPVALELENFQFEGAGLPTISADRLIAKPSLSALVTQKPAGSIEAEGMFNANVFASLAAGATLKDGGRRQDIKADISGLQLAVLTEALRRAGMMSFNIQGVLDSNTNLSIDPSFKDQPQGDFFVQAKTVAIPSVNVPIPNMGSVQTPSLQMGRLEVKGRMAEGKFQLEDVLIGQEKDSLSGRIRGEMDISVRAADGQPARVVPGAYNLRVELQLTKSLMDAMVKSGAALAFIPVEGFKTEVGDLVKYAFRVQAPSFAVTPVFSKLVP